MRPEVFAEFLSRQGHRVFRTKSCYWYDAQPGFYFYFPYHRLISPSDEELNVLLWGRFCVGARFFSPLDDRGKGSYLLVMNDKRYDISFVDAQYARRQTRRGLEHFQIKQVDFEYLSDHGLTAVHDTLHRQHRTTRIWERRKWQQFCDAASALDGFEAWAAFEQGNLASFMIAFLMEDHFTVLHQSSATRYLHLYPNNALIFHVTARKLASPEVGCVFYGPESLDAPESLDKFKCRMGFVKSPMRQRIVFNPLVNPFVNRFSHSLIHWASSRRPGSDTWRKLAGIVDFYREQPYSPEVRCEQSQSEKG